MIKHRDVPIGSTNIALFGTDVEKNIKHHAAEGEPAWKTAGRQEGLQAWRIKQFKLEPVPDKALGSFYDGDSYIVLETKKVNNSFHWDIFFWLGHNTTQDEAGTAAYKTVELDDHFDGAPVQHREVQGYESNDFVHLFSAKGGIRILSGGYETGFHHVKPENYKPRLLQVRGSTPKNVRVHEVELVGKSLNSTDVFILDAGLKVYQFNGKHSPHVERTKAAVLANAMADERENGASVVVFDEGDSDLAPFWQFFGGPQQIAAQAPAQEVYTEEHKKLLFKITDAAHPTKVAEGSLSKSSLSTNDIFVLDSGVAIFVWVGKAAPKKERKTSLQHAIDYIKREKRPNSLPISRILEGHENESFRIHFSS